MLGRFFKPPSMISFAFRGTIADLDETTPDEPCHPSLVLVIEVDQTFSRVIAPDGVLDGRRQLLCAGRPIEVFGEVKRYSHIATELRLVGVGH